MGARRIIWLLAVRLAFGGIVLSSVIPIERLLAQEPDVPGAAAGIVPRSSAEVLERPIGVLETVGHVNQTVSTNSPEAQAYYNQGVALLHSYVWIDAARV